MAHFIDALLTCSTCGQKGFPCKCIATCDLCGMFYRAKHGKCTHPVHRFDAEVENAFRNGYWRVDETTNRLYKTRAGNKQHIYRELVRGKVFFSRKEFNEFSG